MIKNKIVIWFMKDFFFVSIYLYGEVFEIIMEFIVFLMLGLNLLGGIFIELIF